MKRLLFIIVISLLCCFTTFAASPQVPLGTLKFSQKSFTLNQVDLPVYTVSSEDYIALFPLKDLGYQVGCNTYTNTVVVNKPTKAFAYELLSTEKYWTTESLENTPYQLYDGTIYIEGLVTHGILSNNRVLVPVQALSALGKIHNTSTGYFLTFAPDAPITADASTVKNFSSESAFVSVTDLFWDKTWITRTTSYKIEPYSSINRNLNYRSSERYVSSIITTIKSNSLDVNHFNMLGQFNTSLFELNNRALAIGDLSDLGDSITLEEALWAEDNIRKMSFSSETPFLIWTDIKTQRTYIFENRQDEWQLIKYFLCSTGKSSSPTPKGEYALTRKVPYFGTEKGYRCKNAFGFIGTTYLYHSVMFDVTGTYELQGKGTLGRQASAGCIRLSPENSLWLYNNMLPGTKVYIQ